MFALPFFSLSFYYGDLVFFLPEGERGKLFISSLFYSPSGIGLPWLGDRFGRMLVLFSRLCCILYIDEYIGHVRMSIIFFTLLFSVCSSTTVGTSPTY